MPFTTTLPKAVTGPTATAKPVLVMPPTGGGGGGGGEIPPPPLLLPPQAEMAKKVAISNPVSLANCVFIYLASLKVRRKSDKHQRPAELLDRWRSYFLQFRVTIAIHPSR